MDLLDAEAVAKMLGMTKDWVYAEVRGGRMPHLKLGRYVRFRRESIEAWLLEAERGKIVGQPKRPGGAQTPRAMAQEG